MKRRARAERWTWLGYALAVGCTPAKMAVPPAVAKSAEVFEATDRSSWTGSLVDEGFSFGPYRVAGVDRDWNSSSGFAVGPFSDKKATTGYAYEVRVAEHKLEGRCGSETKQGSWSLSESSEIRWTSTTLACSCTGTGAPATLTWSPDQSEVVLAGRRYPLEPITETEEGGSTPEPLGFSSEPLGAVEINHPGRLWLDRGLDAVSKAQATCLFAGLMLYQPPSEDD